MSKKRRPFTSVASQKAIAHLDSRTPQHAEDRKKYRQRREELNWMEGFSHTFLHDEKFKFLGSGIVMNADGDELDSEAYNKLMAEESEARKEYEVWEDYLVKKTGKRRTGWRTRSNLVKKKGKVVKHRGILQLPITFRPDHALALHGLSKVYEKNEAALELLRDHVKSMAMKSAELFEKESNMEVLAVMIHPDEGCLHFHLVYSQTTRDKKRLSTPGVGQSSFPTMGLNLTGTFRCYNNGIDVFDGNIDRGNQYIQRRIKDGELPVDWVVCEYLDGMMEYIRSHSGLSIHFDKAYEAWKRAAEGDLKRPVKESCKGKKYGPLNTIAKEQPDLGLQL